MAKVRASHVILFVLVVLAAAVAAAAIYIPRYAKSRIIEAAAAEGIQLTIDTFAIVPGQARLGGVHAAVAKVPGLVLVAKSVDVDLDGFTPIAITAKNADVTLDGSLADVRAGWGEFTAGRSKGPGTLSRITFEASSLTWKRIVSDLTLTAKPLDGNVTRAAGRELGDDYRFETHALHFWGDELPAWECVAQYGPKGRDIQMTVGDSSAPNSPRVHWTSNGPAFTFDANWNLTTVKALGVPANALGLAADDTSKIELHLHHADNPPKAEGTVVLLADGVFIGHSTARTNVKVDGKYSGDGKGPYKVAAATLQAGPFTGALEGTFEVADRALKAHMTYSSGLMSCADAVKAQAANYGDVGKGIAAFANILGLDKAVEGRIALKGTIDLDTAGKSDVAFHTTGDCKLSYLPSP